MNNIDITLQNTLTQMRRNKLQINHKCEMKAIQSHKAWINNKINK